MLQIRLLGQFDVRLDGRRVLIPSRPAQSLFAYLALSAGTPHRREKLAGIFWPDTSEESARKNLRHELWRIRKGITTQQMPALADFLLAEEFTISFNPEAAYWLDVHQFEKPHSDLESLSSNLSVYRGELLPGFYDEWVVLEREHLQSVFDAKMEQLVDQLVAAERWTTVQEQAEHWLSLGNTLEPAYRALMIAYGARGDMAKVSSIYQRCMQELDEQFGLEPSAETRALYDGLLKGAQISSRPAAQPSGTVTFLFTDIEGSTNLLDQLGDQYANVLAQHHEILRTAIQKWNGREADTKGDAFFVTFTRSLDAVQCAAEAQRLLTSHAWPHGHALRVRMGLHTGEPLIASTGYVGMDVHRAARIGDAAHGGQVLLSQTTRELVVRGLPPGLTIRDLGEYRLKDLKFPTPLYQLIIEGLAQDFPPLRTKFTGTEAPIPGEPPFKGLQYFEEVDSDLFFGREVLTAKLVKRLQETEFLSVVIGASGSGKSSLVRAGLIPALKKGETLIDGTKPPEGSADWQVHIVTPTAHPLEALAIELTRDSESVTAAATLIDDLLKEPRSLALFLARQDSKRHTLLVIDQFEELFTLCRDEFEREAFIDNLLTTLSPAKAEGMGEGRVTLILTLRADFYAHLAQYPELRDAVAKQQEYIGPMTLEELRRAIEEPARRGHWAFEPGLVDLILRDVGDEPGALPLLSHALLETWKRRAGHTLTLKGYADAGGVRGAIAHTAESVYQNLSTDEQTIARDIFLRLTELGEGTEDTRRRASFHELMSHTENTEEVRRVLNRLAEARLITLGEDSAEVAHEALIREWPTLREWLNQDREGLQLHRRLTEAAHEWELLERDPGALYRGSHLAQAREWAVLHPSALNVGEKAFLEASNVLEQKEAADREAQQRRELESAQKLAATEHRSASQLRRRAIFLSVAFVLAILSAAIALFFSTQSRQNAVEANRERANAVEAQATTQGEKEAADKAATISSSRELAAQAELNLGVDPERSILLALAGLNKAHTSEAEYALHEAVSASRLRLTLTGHKGPVDGVAYSPDGKLIASGGEDGTARLWDATTGKQLLNLQHPKDVKLVLFSPDGTHLITGANDGVVRIWDVSSGKQLLKIIATQAVLNAGPWDFSVVISPDGKLLATVAGNESSVKFWDAHSGTELFTLNSPDWHNVAPGTDHGLAFSPDGKHLAISLVGNGLGRIEIWDVSTHQRVKTLEGSFDASYPTTFSPDGKRLASASGPDGNADVWDVASGKILFHLVVSLNDIHFSTDGRHLFGAGHGGFFQVFDAETGNELLNLSADIGRTYDSAGSPDCVHPPVATFDWCSPRLAVVGDGDVIKIWDISPTGKQELLTLPGEGFALNADGTHLATVTYDPFPPGPGSKVTFQQWTLPAEINSNPTSGYASSSFQLDDHFRDYFFFNAGILAMDFDNGPIKFWDATQNGKPIYPISCCTWKDGMMLAFSSRAHPRLAIGDINTGTILIWDLMTDKKVQTVQVAQSNDPAWPGLYFFYLNPDGEHLVTIRNDAITETWDVTTGKKLFTMPGPNIVDRSNIDFSADGKLLVISDCGGTSVVRNAATGTEIRRFSTRQCSDGAAFSADDKLMVLSSPNMEIWNLETGQDVLTLPAQGWEPQFTADGKHVVAALEFEALTVITINVYFLQLDDLVALAKTRVTRSLTTAECQQYLHVASCPVEP